jgi:hypothetical protein
MKYHIWLYEDYCESVVPNHNMYDSLEEALADGEKCLEVMSDSCLSEGEWVLEAFNFKIFDSAGRIYYKSVESEYCDFGTIRYLECEGCNDKSLENCRNCQKECRDDRSWGSDELRVGNVVWARSYDFMDKRRLNEYISCLPEESRRLVYKDLEQRILPEFKAEEKPHDMWGNVWDFHVDWKHNLHKEASL